MRKFAWIFMAAMTVAGFSACSNTEDEPVLPGMGGGNGDGTGTGTGSSVVLTDTIYQFNNIKDNYIPINDLCPGWTHEIVSPIGDDRSWQSAKFTNNQTGITEKYIKVTSYDSSNKNAGKSYDLWMFSPALNVKDATNKVFSFYSEYAFWAETASLEVYVLNEPKSTASKEKLDVKIANPENSPLVNNDAEKYKGWVASGDISLEGKGDVVYIGFRYQGEGGTSATTYCIDDFAFGRTQVEHYLGESGGDTPEPTPDVDWTKAISVAEALTQADNSTFAVKGHIVGCIKNNPSKTFFETFAEAQAAGDIEWAGATAFTGYSQVFIADDAAETDGSKCLLVKLNDTEAAKALRNEAKLEGNADRIGMTIYIQGLKKANYGLPGIREISAYKVGE